MVTASSPNFERNFINYYNRTYLSAKRLGLMLAWVGEVLYALWDGLYLGMHHPGFWVIILGRMLFVTPLLAWVYYKTHSLPAEGRLDRWLWAGVILMGANVLWVLHTYKSYGLLPSDTFGPVMYLMVVYFFPGLFWWQKVSFGVPFALLYVLQLDVYGYPPALLVNSSVYMLLLLVAGSFNSLAFDRYARGNFFKNQLLTQMASTDKLTGLANRYRFDETLESLIAGSFNSKQGLALAFVDIDWFKRYNDHYGHLEGDVCLTRVADALAHVQMTGESLAVRFGGEEFILICHPINQKDLARWGESILRAVSGAAMPHVLSDYGHVTVSAGIAYTDVQHILTRSELMQLADEALYAAKQGGRNCFRIAPSNGAPIKKPPV